MCCFVFLFTGFLSSSFCAHRFWRETLCSHCLSILPQNWLGAQL